MNIVENVQNLSEPREKVFRISTKTNIALYIFLSKDSTVIKRSGLIYSSKRDTLFLIKNNFSLDS